MSHLPFPFIIAIFSQNCQHVVNCKRDYCRREVVRTSGCLDICNANFMLIIVLYSWQNNNKFLLFLVKNVSG